MKLIYLTEANLKDRLFIKDLVHNYKFSLDENVVMAHAPFGGTVRDTRFVTKRISTLLSETLVYNNAFNVEQRGLVKPVAGGLAVNVGLIEQLVAPIHLVILGPVAAGADGPELIDPLALVEALRHQLSVDEVIVFTSNPLSPLGRKNTLIEQRQQVEELAQVYDEEKEALELAYRLRPARLASPVTYAQSSS